MKKWNAIIFSILILNSCSGMLSKEKFKSSDSALIVIDVQNAYLPVYKQGTFLQNIKSLIDNAREAGVPVIYIRNIESYMVEGSKDWKFFPSLKPLDSELVIEKEYPSSFSHTDLKKVLDELKVENLILTGLASSGCYGATVYASRQNNFNTIVVEDAHADQLKGRAENLNKNLINAENIQIITTENIIFINR